MHLEVSTSLAYPFSTPGNIPLVAFLGGLKSLVNHMEFSNIFRLATGEMRQRNGDRCTRILLDYSLTGTDWELYSLHQIKIIILLHRALSSTFAMFGL